MKTCKIELELEEITGYIEEAKCIFNPDMEITGYKVKFVGENKQFLRTVTINSRVPKEFVVGDKMTLYYSPLFGTVINDIELDKVIIKGE